MSEIATRSMTWGEIQSEAIVKSQGLGQEYVGRLQYEIKEIDKQGAVDDWVTEVNSGKTFDKNPNGLVLPFVLGLTPIDPIANNIKHNIVYTTDFPDVDTDLLPGAREKIEQFAAQEYGQDKVCSVGLWQTYKPKLALQDVARAMGVEVDPIISLTKNLPDEFDDLKLDEALKEFPEFRKFAESNKELVSMAYRMVSKLKAQGRHAGGLIIANVPIKDHIPLTLCSGRWTSAWTEGHSSQLSKFGFVKFDMLGLTTLLYIKTCLELIKKNRGIIIDWSDIDPEADRAGWQTNADGTRIQISLNDPKALQLANELRTETVFQFETEFAKSILQKGGVKSFNDLVVYTSLGRPGPLPMIESYIKRRDGKEEWKKGEHPIIIETLKNTFGITVFQEDLATLWQKLAGFTVPEAEKARKAVAKKRIEDFALVEAKWMIGATKTLGEQKAKEWWEKFATFARYAFNRSHSVAYIVLAQRCLYLKAHFPAEWWAAVMSDCDSKRLSKYMGYAKAEGVEFGSLDCDNFHAKFTVLDNVVSSGLMGIKNMPSDFAENVAAARHKYESIDDFVVKHGKNKIACERLIKLGAFDKKHPNRKATWIWYQFAYGTDDDSKLVSKLVRCSYAWPLQEIIKERERREHEYRTQYPKRKKIPPSITKWFPKSAYKHCELKFTDKLDNKVFENAKYIQLTKEQVTALVPDDFTLKELLKFEKEYLGYCCHSPMKLFKYNQDYCIAKAKPQKIVQPIQFDDDSKVAQPVYVIDVYVEKFTIKKKNTEFGELIVTDGIENAKVMIWGGDLTINGHAIFKEGNGIRMRVLWKDQYKSYNLKNGTIAIPLERI